MSETIDRVFCPPSVTLVLRKSTSTLYLLMDLDTVLTLLASIGAFGFGFSVDIIGRKWAFNLTCLITSIFGTLIVSPPQRRFQPSKLVFRPTMI